MIAHAADGPDAQVESVDTLERFRGRAVARALILRAVESARAAGPRTCSSATTTMRGPTSSNGVGPDIGRNRQFMRWPQAALPATSGP